MHACDLIAVAIPPEERAELPEAPAIGFCCVTGVECPTIARHHRIGPSFTDHGTLRAPGSQRLGVAAYHALGYKWERMSLWWCDGERFIRPDRAGVRERILSGDYGARPWAGYITTSYKKHGALRAPVNSGARSVWLFENLLVDCSDRSRLLEWWRVMTEAQKQGISRTSMEAMDMPAGILVNLDPMEWQRFRLWAAPKSRAPLYQLLCYLLPSADELKAAGIEVRKPKKEKQTNVLTLQSDLFA